MAHHHRPVVVLGGGVLGRRIACVFAAGGYNVYIHDTSLQAREAAAKYVDDHIEKYIVFTKYVAGLGSCSVISAVDSAIFDAWLVVEALPEVLELKMKILGQLDKMAPEDCVFASNSSSFKSSLMLKAVSPRRRQQILNIHFYMPPFQRAVELMSSGETDPDILPSLCGILEACGMLPFVVRRESTGFIFNRLWAAIKREILLILAEGVSEPAEIDRMWEHIFRSSVPPCQLMDQIGLDTVAAIEDNYIYERGLDGNETVNWLRENYIQHGLLGVKSPNGGLYPPEYRGIGCSSSESPSGGRLSIYLVDVGLGANLEDISQSLENGRILRLDPDSSRILPLISRLMSPDSIAISASVDRMFWSSMGHLDSTADGSLWSARLDGTDVRMLMKNGVHTPKQLTLEDETKMIYFCDREGMNVQRCGFTGHSHEILVQLGGNCIAGDKATCWCVGVAVDTKAQKLYWSQKGPSKAGRGRICRAGINIPVGEAADNRSDIEILFEGLPEPVDLDLDQKRQLLYWTDRGEHPRGCSLNRAYVGRTNIRTEPEILARHLHEPVGVKFDALQDKVYVTDLGGSVYCISSDGSGKEILVRDGGSYTGIALGRDLSQYGRVETRLSG